MFNTVQYSLLQYVCMYFSAETLKCWLDIRIYMHAYNNHCGPK